MTSLASTRPPIPTAAATTRDHVDVDSDREGAVGARTDDVGRAADPGSAGRDRFAEQPQRRKLSDEIPDGGAAQAQPLGQFGSGQSSVEVNMLKNERQVVTPHGVLAHRRRPDQVPFSLTRAWRGSAVSASARRRERASTAAAISSTAPVMTS